MEFLRCYRETGTIARAPGTDQASKLTPKILRVIEKQIEKKDKTTGLELQKLLLKEVEGFDTSLSSIHRWRNDFEWTAKGTKYCQMIRDVTKESRLIKWVEKNQDMTFQNIIYTHETTVHLETDRRTGCYKQATP